MFKIIRSLVASSGEAWGEPHRSTRRISVMTSTAPAVGELREPPVLDALLRPRGVALIGASRDPKALGGRPLGFMARYGYQGRVYPVNGKGGEVQGVPAYASILDLPEPVDLALVMVRAELVAGVLRDCAASGVRVAVILSSGFGEGTGAGEGILESVAHVQPRARPRRVRHPAPRGQRRRAVAERRHGV